MTDEARLLRRLRRWTAFLIAGALVVPWALAFGAWRGIPIWWRAINSLFGLGAMLPAWACLRWVGEPEQSRPVATPARR
ncbi:MAG: hypothetical protein ACKOET_16720 [Verrucomicrobiota bacterium]